jgi:hypothetical protein
MTVRTEGLLIRLEGWCAVEEAEILAAKLEGEETRTVDLSGCRHLHGAVLQTLLAFVPKIEGVPEDPLLRRLLAPILACERPPAPRNHGCSSATLPPPLLHRSPG